MTSDSVYDKIMKVLCYNIVKQLLHPVGWRGTFRHAGTWKGTLRHVGRIRSGVSAVTVRSLSSNTPTSEGNSLTFIQLQ